MNPDTYLHDFSRFYILTLLYEAPSHGYELMDKFKRRLGREVSPSLVYPFLMQLEQKGYVTHSVTRIGAKQRKIFQLTTKGEELCKHLFKRFSALVSTAIEPTLDVCAHCGCKVYEGGYKEKIGNRQTVFCCVHCANVYKQERGEKP